jgi:hypothetical protein
MASDRAQGRVGSLTVAALAVALVAQACGGAPAGSLAAGGPSGPMPSESARPSGSEPTDAASTPNETSPPPTNIGTTWTALKGFPEAGHILDGARGDGGWVGVGLCTTTIDCSDGPVAGALWSEDGSEWQEGAVQDPGDTSWIDHVSWNGSYVAAGTQYRLGGTATSIVIWGSADGRSWDVLGRIRFGDCGEGCPSVGSIARSTSGAMVLTAAHHASGPGVGVYESRDGQHFARLDPFVFGRSEVDVNAADLVSYRDRVVLAASPTLFAPTHVWTTSEDGTHWEFGGELGSSGPLSISLAASPDRVVAALPMCNEDRCYTELWSSADTQIWTRNVAIDGVDSVRLAFTGEAFVFVGTGSSGPPVVMRSVDGTWWADAASDLTLDGECADFWLAGGAGEALIGEADCGIWRSVNS